MAAMFSAAGAISGTRDSTPKKNPLQGLCAISSKAPWYGRHILRDVDSIELVKLFTPRPDSIAHCCSLLTVWCIVFAAKVSAFPKKPSYMHPHSNGGLGVMALCVGRRARGNLVESGGQIAVASSGRLPLFSTLLLTHPNLARWHLIRWVVLAGAEQQADAPGVARGVIANVANAASIAQVAMHLPAQWSYLVLLCPAWATPLLILSGVDGVTALLALPRWNCEDGIWSCSWHWGALWVGFGCWSEEDFYTNSYK